MYCAAGQATDGNTIRRMCLAFWITKATDNNSEYGMLIVFPLQKWLYQRSSILHYKYIGCLVLNNICNLSLFMSVSWVECVSQWNESGVD
jgi:hypothetical protein